MRWSGARRETPQRGGHAFPSNATHRRCLLLCDVQRPGAQDMVAPQPRITVAAFLPFDSVFYGRATRVLASASGDASLVAAARFTWSSSDTTVAVVDSSGVVLGVGPGMAKIRAEYLGERGETSVRVVLQEAGGGERFAFGSTTAGDGQCAIAEGGALYCRRVAPSPDSMQTFTRMPGAASLRFAEVHTAFGTQCGLALDRQIYCWGENRRWIFATNGVTSAPTAFAVRHAALRFSAMTAGGHEQLCAISRADGVVYCWGHNDGYQLGRSPLSAADSSVRPMSGSPTGRSVSTRNFITCFVDTSLALRCAGEHAPSLGLADPSADGSALQPLIGGRDFSSVYFGDQFVCALTIAGAAWCAGRNTGGQLGIGITAEPPSHMLRPVAGDHRFRELSVSNTRSSNAVCGITTDSELYCWGPFSPTASISPPRPSSCRPDCGR